MIVDLGTGRFNVAQGAVATLQGTGAASSGLIAGVIVDRAGYTAAFLAAAAIAAIALAALVIMMPETAPRRCSAVNAARDQFDLGPAIELGE